MKTISGITIKYIEAKLRSREQIEETISQWERNIISSGGGTRDNIPNVGFFSDPTANKALKLTNPPPYIREALGWIEVIDKTIEYAKKHNSYNLYFVFYENSRRQTATAAYTHLGMPERTFRDKRGKIVNYAGVKALEKGLLTKLYC